MFKKVVSLGIMGVVAFGVMATQSIASEVVEKPARAEKQLSAEQLEAMANMTEEERQAFKEANKPEGKEGECGRKKGKGCHLTEEQKEQMKDMTEEERRAFMEANKPESKEGERPERIEGERPERIEGERPEIQ
ncbi:MAG: hypothetical protein BEN19_02870 [Epulopiscium sp. Nuni2H_MBin003]|nr:MAG: hypothetical protein BEN19_02870 [Epulopiscium sp. Nuni2H_MBin003]